MSQENNPLKDWSLTDLVAANNLCKNMANQLSNHREGYETEYLEWLNRAVAVSREIKARLSAIPPERP